jgi:hypothetical protein
MTPRFEDVPEHWKHPEGPYRQAPEEYGGEWWLVNPFASGTPWLTQSQLVLEQPLPEGFEEIFGPRPKASDYSGPQSAGIYFQAVLVDWQQNLRFFKRAGVPEWASEESITLAGDTFASWGMGRPRYYEGRYGWSARFIDSEIPEFESGARAALQNTHLLVAQYQLALLDRGIVPERRHPFVPPHVWPKESAVEKED